jgi:hypothetical protein
VQLVYLDEAGISNKMHEPYLVVAGVIVNADQKWKHLEQHFLALAEELTPDFVPYYGKQLIFHAKDIWHGTGLFDRKKWSLATRMKILEQLATIPNKFDLPIVLGYLNRDQFHAYCIEHQPRLSRNAIDLWAHGDAFLNSIKRVEKWMELNAPDEVAMLIAEDRDRVKKIIDAIHSTYTDRSNAKMRDGEVQILIEPMRRTKELMLAEPFRSQFIVDAIYFARKESSLLLQIADHCAFFAKRKLMKCPHISPLYEKIAPQIAFRPAKGSGIVARMPITSVAPHHKN